MDDIVRQALAKWPDVPDCTGWLALDARGRWRIGNEKDGTRQPITNAAMNGFIARNYLPVGRCWVFQNGPQRVFVELEYTPFVWRLLPREDEGWTLQSHTGAAATPSAVWLDDAGRFVVEATFDGVAGPGARVVGVVHDHDTALMAGLLRDADGAPLDDDVVAQLAAPAEARASGSAPSTHKPGLCWPRAGDEATRVLPLQRLVAAEAPMRFGFEPRPSRVVRVDVDSRR